jgi:hypothetical protein
MNECVSILNKIIEKGGIMGVAASMYINDEEKSKQFLYECFEQCHNKSAINHWGEGLVKEIVNFQHNCMKHKA